jgi:hypothetical protein
MIKMNIWSSIRLFIFLYVLFVSSTISLSKPSTTTWLEAIIFPAVFWGLSVLWMWYGSYKPDVIWSEPYSLTKPFFPITTYPTQFLMLFVALGFLAGFVGVVREILAHQALSPDCAMSLLHGVFGLAAVNTAKTKRR